MIPIEAKIAAVKIKHPHAFADTESSAIWSGLPIDGRVGKWGELLSSHGWDSAFSRITPAARALAVECPVCKVISGRRCGNWHHDFEGEQWLECEPHPERIAAVEREEKFQHLATSDPEGHLQELTEEAAHAAEQDDLGIEDLLFANGELRGVSEYLLNEINKRIRRVDRRAFERGKKAGM